MPKISHIFLLLSITIIISNAQAYPIDITDDFGNTFTIEKSPERIVSLSPCNTEILFAVGAGDKVVGGTTYDMYPPEAVNLSKIGGFSSVNIEQVINLSPDLILAQYGNGEETINALKKLNLTVISLHPKTVDDILDNILLVGNITENDDTAISLTADMIRQMENITRQTENIPDERKPGVLYIVWHDPIYAAGLGSYPDDLITMAGGKNIIKGEGWPIISLEQIIDKNPDIIICSGMGGGSYTIMEAITNNSVLAQTDAVKKKKVYPIADPNIIELAGPRIVEGLFQLHGYMAPEIESNATPIPTNASQSPGPGIIFVISIILMAYLIKRY